MDPIPMNRHKAIVEPAQVSEGIEKLAEPTQSKNL